MKTLACTLSLAIVTALVGCGGEAPKPTATPPVTMPGGSHEGAAPAGHAADPAAPADPAAGAADPAAPADPAEAKQPE